MQRRKVLIRAEVGIFVGVDCGDAARIFLTESRKGTTWKGVFFDENQVCDNMSPDASVQYVCFDMPEMKIKYQSLVQPDESNSGGDPAHDPNSAGINMEIDDASHKDIQEPQTDPSQNGGDNNVEHISSQIRWDGTLKSLTHDPSLKRSARHTAGEPPQFYSFYVATVSSVLRENGQTSIQTSYKSAIETQYSVQRLAAMKEKILSFCEEKVWELVPLSAGCQADSVRWTFSLKVDSNKKMSRLKAQSVGKGFRQAEGVDFNDVFSPVSKYSTVELIFAIMVSKCWTRITLDIETVYFKAPLDHKFYVDQSGIPLFRAKKTTSTFSKKLYMDFVRYLVFRALCLMVF